MARRSFKDFLWSLLPLPRRRVADRALRFGLQDLEIDWPVRLRWRRNLKFLGLVRGPNQHEIQVRPDQAPAKLERTIYHEVYHLAQFHKWRTLPVRREKGEDPDVEYAEAIAELYSWCTYRELRKARTKRRRLWGYRLWGRRRASTGPAPAAAAAPAQDPRPPSTLPGYTPFSKWPELSGREHGEVARLVEWRRPY